jgi:hypothetical protein
MPNLQVDPDDYRAVLAHLLPIGDGREQAAFLFATRAEGSDDFTVVDAMLMGAADLAEQYSDYLELTDEARIRVTKRARVLGASIVEMHSHPSPLPAAFSLADRKGLRETVPQMWWRLKGRPYFAIVVAPSGFDALAWLENPNMPHPLEAIVAGGERLIPTNNSLGGWS